MIARLNGGPFCGDAATLAESIAPDCLWCVQCADPGECEQGGVHWWKKPAAAEQDAKRQRERGGFASGWVHRYLHDRVLGGGIHVYVYADLTASGLSSLREQRPEPVQA